MYNVGDKLVCIKEHLFTRKVGEIVTINSISDSGTLEHATSSDGYCRILKSLLKNWELVKPITPEFKEGDTVYYRGTKYKVVKPYLKYHIVDITGNEKYRFADDLSKDEPVKEMTMADLEKHFGMKVKVIK